MNNIYYDYSELRGKIIAKFGTLDNFASAINKKPQHVSKKLISGLPFKTSEAEQWAYVLELKVPDDIGVYFFTHQVK